MAASKWFDYNGYMANKLIQVQKAEPDAKWDMTKLVNAFDDNGFAAAEGAEKHFAAYGQFEDVAPNAFFNAEEYYRAKAAEFYKKDPKVVTELDAANIKLEIQKGGMSAWSHYEQYGNSEGVNPSNSFDTTAYMTAKLDAMKATEAGKDMTMVQLNAAFKTAGLSALEHFMIYGGAGAGEVTMKYDGKIPAEFAVPEKDQVNSGGITGGNSIALTGNVDNLVGTAGEDTFYANNLGMPTLNGGDALDGYGGTDTLTILNDGGAGNFVHASIKNIEIVRMAGNATAVINVADNADVQELWFDGGTVGAGSQLREDQKLGFTGDVTGAAVIYKDVKNTADDAATLAFKDATVTGSLTIKDIESLTFELAGKNEGVNVSATAATSLTIEGEGGGNITVGGGTVTSIDTTGFTGGLSLTLSNPASTTLAYKGGAGNEHVNLKELAGAEYNIDLGAGDDTLTLGTSTLAAGAKIDGGADYDTLGIGKAYNKIDFSHTTGFEALHLAGTMTQDVSLFAGNDIIVGAGTAHTYTLHKLRANQDITVTDSPSTGSATVVLTYDPPSGAPDERTVNLILDDMDGGAEADMHMAAISETSTTSINTLNITSAGTVQGQATLSTPGDANVIGSISGLGGLKTVNIEGDSDLHLTTGAAGALTVNAADFEGNLIFDGTATAGILRVTGGLGNDHIAGGTSSDVLKGGDGNDTLVAGAGTAGLDKLSGGDGIDTFSVAGVAFSANGAAVADSTSTMVTIEDFEAGESIMFTATAATKLIKHVGAVSSVEQVVMDIMKGTAVSIQWFQYDGNTYIVNDNGTTNTGTGYDAADQVVKLVGEKDLSTAVFDATADTLTW